jgi:hypothetical protein
METNDQKNIMIITKEMEYIELGILMDNLRKKYTILMI